MFFSNAKDLGELDLADRPSSEIKGIDQFNGISLLGRRIGPPIPGSPGQVDGNGDFSHGILGEGDPDGIPQSVEQKGTDTDGALDAGIFTIPSFGYAEMERIVHVLVVHEGDHKPIGFDHNLRVTGLHGQDDLMKVVLAGNPDEFQCGFSHSSRGISEPVHDSIGERAMLRSDPHGTAEFPATQNKRRKGFVQAFQFLDVLRVAVFANLKFLSVGIVPRVDPDFVDVFHCFHGGLGKKVNIRNQGKIEA